MRATLERLANNGASMDRETAFALTLERGDADPVMLDRPRAG